MFWGIDLSLILRTRKVAVKVAASFSFQAVKDGEQKSAVIVEGFPNLVELLFGQIGK